MTKSFSSKLVDQVQIYVVEGAIIFIISSHNADSRPHIECRWILYHAEVLLRVNQASLVYLQLPNEITSICPNWIKLLAELSSLVVVLELTIIFMLSDVEGLWNFLDGPIAFGQSRDKRPDLFLSCTAQVIPSNTDLCLPRLQWQVDASLVQMIIAGAVNHLEVNTHIFKRHCLISARKWAGVHAIEVPEIGGRGTSKSKHLINETTQAVRHLRQRALLTSERTCRSKTACILHHPGDHLDPLAAVLEEFKSKILFAIVLLFELCHELTQLACQGHIEPQ